MTLRPFSFSAAAELLRRAKAALPPCALALYAAIPGFCGSSSVVRVRLENGLGSYLSAKGSQFRCVLVAPLVVDGQVVAPRHSEVVGTVVEARRVGLGLVHERARLRLGFERIETPDGAGIPIEAELTAVENAREHVSHGRIEGILAAQTPNGLVNGMWYRPSLHYFARSLVGMTGATYQIWERLPVGIGGAAGLIALRCALFPFPEPEIRLPAGATFDLRVELPPNSDWKPYAAETAPDVPADFADWLATQPRKIAKPHGQPVDDLINLAFAGSEEDLTSAFENAGWDAAEPMSAHCVRRIYGAFNEKQTFRTAPVSMLHYRKREPDFVFQRSLNTISQRDHIRIWRAGEFSGQTIWLGAATHDSGIRFRARHFAFSHRIDEEIDMERSRIADDLTFAGCAQPAAYLEEAAPSSGEAVTDGRIAALALQPCAKSTQPEPELAPLPGTKASRALRRLILESRSYVLRENFYYWAYQLLRRRPS